MEDVLTKVDVEGMTRKDLEELVSDNALDLDPKSYKTKGELLDAILPLITFGEEPSKEVISKEESPEEGDSTLRVWVNPAGPRFTSVSKTLEKPEGFVEGSVPPIFKVVRADVEGPKGFLAPTEELYEWLLQCVDLDGNRFFQTEAPPEKPKAAKSSIGLPPRE